MQHCSVQRESLLPLIASEQLIIKHTIQAISSNIYSQSKDRNDGDGEGNDNGIPRNTAYNTKGKKKRSRFVTHRKCKRQNQNLQN